MFIQPRTVGARQDAPARLALPWGGILAEAFGADNTGRAQRCPKAELPILFRHVKNPISPNQLNSTPWQRRFSNTPTG